MTQDTLAQAYLKKAAVRVRILDALLAEEAYSDVVREAQEAVELALKGILRFLGVEPPKIHDVGSLILENTERLPSKVRSGAERMAEISNWLRKEREFSFYGDTDLVPTEQYGVEDANRAKDAAAFVVEQATIVIN